MLDTTYIISPPPSEGVPESLKPDIHVLDSDSTHGRVAVEPLHKGYGITIGNPLRRVLLNSINGSAITWVKIENVVHEYTSIHGIKEEVMDLLLNIKRIRINSQSERTGKMRLEVSGEGRVCAGDISTSADFEIVNPELHLATLDSEDARLAIEFNVEHGVGYQQATQSEGATTGLPVGVLPVDAIFNPVRKVDYSVERTRVGQVTDYERLVLDVWTDGTITPVDAVREAADTLVTHFFLFSNLNRAAEPDRERPTVKVSPEIYQTPIERLDLSPRTLNCLKRAHITKVGEVLEMSDDELLKIRNFGDKSLEELRDKLAERGIASYPKEVTEDPETGLSAASAAIADFSTQDLGDLMGSDDLPSISMEDIDDLDDLDEDNDQDEDSDQDDEEEF